MEPIRLRQLSVLGGAYLRSGATCLDHYVAEEAFRAGRLRRGEGEPLCRKVDPDNICDIGTAGAVVCPICLRMAHGLQDRGHPVLITMG